MRRLIAFVLLIAVLAVGGGIVATTAYQAGLSTVVTTAIGSGAVVVTPVVVPAYGYGWHPFGIGLGFFGFLATLFFLFIVFGLVRAIFFRAGPGQRGGWGGPGRHGHGAAGDSPWEARAHATFDEWHGLAHEAPSEPSTPVGAA